MKKFIIFLSLIIFNCGYQKPIPEGMEEKCNKQLLQNLLIGEFDKNFDRNTSSFVYAECINRKNKTKGRTILEYDGGRFVY